MKKLFIIQYSHELDQFQLQEVDNPQDLPNFQIPIIDAAHESLISMSTFQVDTEKPICSLPDAQVFANPHNAPSQSLDYGLLYNFQAVSHPNFVPAGWHLPTDEDWEHFSIIAEGSSNVGGMLKETGTEHWQEPNTGASDNFNYTALPGGYREQHGRFYNFGTQARFWANSPYSGEFSYHYYLSYNSASLNRSLADWVDGHSVRLVKDDGVNPGSIFDIDGNEYQTINVGDKIWLAKNWKCTQLNDGTPIENITEDFAWGNASMPAYCAYNNDLSLI